MGLTYPSNKICPRCGTGGYVWYLDNSEYVAKCTNCGHYFRKDDFPMCVLDGVPKPITNADRIRAMSDEELAELLLHRVDRNGDCPISYASKYCKAHECIQCWVDWLKIPVEPGEVENEA